MDNQDRDVFEEATQRVVQNILKSYTGYWDLFSELIQNSLDAIEQKKRIETGHIGQLKINIDDQTRTVAVSDNGIGMGLRELRYCFRPSVSFKNRRETRGHKGVGSTFLAYGFLNVRVQTKQADTKLAVQLSNGRTWAEDRTSTIPRPRLEVIDFSDTWLSGQASGTRFEIHIERGHRPDLGWWSANNAKQWATLLCIRTPLGGVYLRGREHPQVTVEVSITNSAGDRTTETITKPEYILPHELTTLLPKVSDVRSLVAHMIKADGDKHRLPSEFKNLSALWDIWDENDLLDEQQTFNDRFEEAEKHLIRRHQVCVYGCFVASAKVWGQYQSEELKIHRSPLILRGGMQIASDYMVQGDLNVIPLTSTIGYQANTHVVIHFVDGNPDMGRKVFQPEIKALAEKISVQCVNIFKRQLQHMREDTGASSIADSGELWDWLTRQDSRKVSDPLAVTVNNLPCAYISTPQSEQDVIALFHELIGMGLIRGLKFLATSGIFKYDACFLTSYLDASLAYNHQDRPLGVNPHLVGGTRESRPFVLEYKYDFDAFVTDLEKEVKHLSEVDAVVCWTIGSAYKERFRVSSYLVGDEGAGRQYFGATHALWQDREKRLEIYCLSDLIAFVADAQAAIARHRVDYQ